VNRWHYILLPIAAFAKAIMDCAQIGALKWGPFWNEQQAWVYKWQDGDPSKGEAFLFSSGPLVALTSGWHLAQLLFLNLIFACMVLYTPKARIDMSLKTTEKGIEAADMFIFFDRQRQFFDFASMSVGFRIIFEISYRLLKGTL